MMGERTGARASYAMGEGWTRRRRPFGNGEVRNDEATQKEALKKRERRQPRGKHSEDAKRCPEERFVRQPRGKHSTKQARRMLKSTTDDTAESTEAGRRAGRYLEGKSSKAKLTRTHSRVDVRSLTRAGLRIQKC